MTQIPQHRHRRGRAAITLVAATALTASACSGAAPTSGQNASVERVSIPASESDEVTAPMPVEHERSDAVHDHQHGAGDSGPVMALVDPVAATHVASASGRWSSPSTWVGGVEPAPGARVHVPADVTVTVDRVITTEVKTIRVDGTLRFDPDVDTTLMVDTLVTTASGTLEIGTAAAPIGPDVTARIIFADDGPIDRGWDPTLVSRGAILHGDTVIHGSEKRSFAAVSAFPQAGDTTVRLAEAPTGWRPGDQIVIAGTDPSDPTSDERRTITSVEGSVVGIDAPLVLDHAAPRADLEVHVANLTRNVTFSSENSEIGRRGHVMIMHTNNATIDHAAFRGLGRSDKARGYDDIEFVDLNPYLPAEVLGGDNVRGRYSLHFHRGGTDRNLAPATVNGSVVSDDPGWGFVNHSSHVAFTDNVAYDIVGAAYYTEAGDEIGSFTGNIAIRIVNPNLPLKAGAEGEEFDPDARESRQDYGFQGDGMWLHSPNVSVENNVFSGVSGHA